MYPPLIQKLIDKFSKFPTVGPRTAARFVFYLLKIPKNEITELIESISSLKQSIKICSLCFNPFEPAQVSAKFGVGEGEDDFCSICRDPSRDKSLLLIVEKETDLIAIEKTKRYDGLYFVLGGTFSTLKKKDVEKVRSKELLERIKNPSASGLPTSDKTSAGKQYSDFKEIIIAVNPTTEGEATVLYLERLLKSLNKKITRLGRGLPVGGELEYADEETLSSALEGRK